MPGQSLLSTSIAAGSFTVTLSASPPALPSHLPFHRLRSCCLTVSPLFIGNCLHCHFFCDDLYLHVLKFYVCRPAFLGPRCLLCPGRGSQDEAVGQGGDPQPLGKQVKNNPFRGSPPDALSLHTWYGAEESVLLKKLPGDIGGQAGWRPSARHRHCLTAASDSDAQRRQHHLSLRVCPLSCAADLSSPSLFLFVLAQNWSTFCPVDRTAFCENGLHQSWPQTAPSHSAWSLRGPHPAHHLLPTPFFPQTLHSGTRGSSCPPRLSPSTHTQCQRGPPLCPPLAPPPGAPRSPAVTGPACTSVAELLLFCLVSLHQKYLCVSVLRTQPCGRVRSVLIFSPSPEFFRFAWR